jgi:N6-L-threonylcarbamoyladenine synthase
MIILGIETSCDETAVGIVEDGRHILANVIASSADIHAHYGGVVPEIAARSHIEAMLPTITAALKEAKVDWPQIDGIAVTAGPGLLGSLLIGTTTAKILADVLNKPLYAVNHVVAHTYANMLIDHPPSFPLLSLSVSGGHSHLIWFESPLEYHLLGATRDDAAGEAFDKVAKMMGLPYPGGPAITKAAEGGDEKAFALPKPKIDNSLDFSFSGLKTAVLRALQTAVGADFRLPSTELADRLTDKQISDMAASFRATACEILTDHLLAAYERYQPKSVVIAGGVAADQRLRQEVADRLPVEMHYAPIKLCTDNGAMIAAMGKLPTLPSSKPTPASQSPTELSYQTKSLIN